MGKIVTAVITAELPRGVTAKMLRKHFASSSHSITVRTLRSDPRVKGLIAACEGLLNSIHNGGDNGNVLGAAVTALDAIKNAP